MDLEDPTILSRFEEFLKVDKFRNASDRTKYLIYGMIGITGIVVIWMIWHFFIKEKKKPKKATSKKKSRSSKKRTKKKKMSDDDTSDDETDDAIHKKLFSGLPQAPQPVVVQAPVKEKSRYTSELAPDASADMY